MKTARALWIAAVVFLSASFAIAHAETHIIQYVKQAPTRLKLTTSAHPGVGVPVTFTAHLSPATTGDIAFSDSSTSIPAQKVPMTTPGKASWTVKFPSSGTYVILAQYPGGRNYKSSSSVLTEQVISPGVPNFSLSLTPGQAVVPGQSWTGKIEVKPINGFKGTVNLSCGALNSTMTCKFTPVSVTPGPKGTSTTISIGTKAIAVTVAAGALLPFGVLWPFGEDKRRRKRFVLFLLLLCIGIAGCGGANRFTQTNGTPPGTYHVDITGISGSISHSLEATVVVK